MLLESEQDDLYFKAYRENDVDTAMRMVFQAAKEAMPNTKAVDYNGEPMVMYHGTNEDFTSFETKKIRSTNYGKGFYFTSDADDAASYAGDNGRVKAAFLNVRKPLDISTSASDAEYNKWYGKRNIPYDAFIFDFKSTGKRMVVVLNPIQIKSAEPFTFDDGGNLIPLSQRFDFSKNDIRY